jgi:hypothetical protein
MPDAKPKRIRTDAVEYERRLMTIQMWIIERVSSAIIINQILERAWCTSTRHAERMLKAARDKWVAHEGMDIKQRRQLKIQQLNHTIRTLQDQYKGTPAGLQAIARLEKLVMELEGTKMPLKIEHSGDPAAPVIVEVKSNVDYTQLPDDVLKAIVNARVKHDS